VEWRGCVALPVVYDVYVGECESDLHALGYAPRETWPGVPYYRANGEGPVGAQT